METYEQIERREEAARERAWAYGRLRDEQKRLTDTIARLKSRTADTTVLAQIRDLAAKVDPLLTFKGTQFLPGGYLVADLLQVVAGTTLVQLDQRASKTATELASAETKLASVERALEAYS